MRTIGLIGGMSWESTAVYYKEINEIIHEELGGFYSAPCIIYSVNFQEIEDCQKRGDWQRNAELLCEAALCLEKAGAEVVLICSNTMHKVAPQVAKCIHIPLLHIADITASQLLKQERYTVGLLGTKYTMEDHFYKDKLLENGITALIPEKEDRDLIHKIIFEELCNGIIRQDSKKCFLEIMQKLLKQGAQGIILGCTEIGMLVSQEDTLIPLFDTTKIHALAAAYFTLSEE